MQGGPAPDPWKEGSSNDKRKVNENKLLSKSRRREMPITQRTLALRAISKELMLYGSTVTFSVLQQVSAIPAEV